MSFPVRFDEEIVNVRERELFSFVQKGLLSHAVSWCLDYRYRKSVVLSSWLNGLVTSSVDDPVVLAWAHKVPVRVDLDERVFEVFKFVRANLQYVSDQKEWGVLDYWAKPSEVISRGAGDCEDGAVLIYVLARLVGVPADRLVLWCGDTVGGGHCCLFYKPRLFPLNFVALDWCYFFDGTRVASRNLFGFSGSAVEEFSVVSDGFLSLGAPRYVSSWFFFNEGWSTNRYVWRGF